MAMSSHYYTTACQRQRNIADATFVSLLIRLEVKAIDVANRHSTTSLPEQGRRCATITFTPTSKIKLWPNPSLLSEVKVTGHGHLLLHYLLFYTEEVVS